MRLWVALDPSEQSCVDALQIVTVPHLFACGYIVCEDRKLKWKFPAGPALLSGIEMLASYRRQGSPAQTLYGKVYRIHSGVVN